jgi:hypothetical protein
MIFALRSFFTCFWGVRSPVIRRIVDMIVCTDFGIGMRIVPLFTRYVVVWFDRRACFQVEHISISWVTLRILTTNLDPSQNDVKHTNHHSLSFKYSGQTAKTESSAAKFLHSEISLESPRCSPQNRTVTTCTSPSHAHGHTEL